MGAAFAGDSPEFEIWVETDIQADWCLEDTTNQRGQWRDGCSTGSLRRRWEEFVALGQSGSLGTELTFSEALEVLGLPETADASQLASAFRRRCRECHPDKAGSADE